LGFFVIWRLFESDLWPYDVRLRGPRTPISGDIFAGVEADFRVRDRGDFR